MIDLRSVKIINEAVVATPAGNNLMQRGESKILNEKGREAFHTCVAKGIFIGKWYCPDIQPTISVLSSRV